MFKYGCLLCLLCAAFSCKQPQQQHIDKTGSTAHPPDISLDEFKHLDWIVGNWKTQVEGPGFYQDIRFTNDSTLEIRSYQLNGKDTSNTNLASLFWRNQHLYMGVNAEWVVVSMTDSTLRLDPVRQGWLAIDWKKNSQEEWTMTHSKTDFRRSIKMKRQPALEELMK